MLNHQLAQLQVGLEPQPLRSATHTGPAPVGAPGERNRSKAAMRPHLLQKWAERGYPALCELRIQDSTVLYCRMLGGCGLTSFLASSSARGVVW